MSLTIPKDATGGPDAGTRAVQNAEAQRMNAVEQSIRRHIQSDRQRGPAPGYPAKASVRAASRGSRVRRRRIADTARDPRHRRAANLRQQQSARRIASSLRTGGICQSLKRVAVGVPVTGCAHGIGLPHTIEVNQPHRRSKRYGAIMPMVGLDPQAGPGADIAQGLPAQAGRPMPTNPAMPARPATIKVTDISG